MLAGDFFTTERLKAMRNEICEGGFVADKFLTAKADGPVFGVNLACLYPFPREVRDVYESLAERFAALDSGVYVYPAWETHVTIVTFINFAQHESPSMEQLAELKQVMNKVGHLFQAEFANSVKAFDLWIEPPLISRKAAILPLSDPTDSVTRIRHRVMECLTRKPVLRKCLDGLGLNVPPLVHSTIMRFKKVPADTQQFLSRFDEISRSVPRVTMRVAEVYITSETKPYMRAGEIVRRFPLT